MEERRTAPVWFKNDAAWLAGPVARELGYEHGSGGPLAFIHLKGCAKLQEGVRDRRGEVEIGWRQLAEAAYLDEVEKAKAIIDLAVELGEVEIVEDRGRVVLLYLVNYEVEQGAPSSGGSAQRMREKRERDRRRKLEEARALGVDVPDDASVAEIERAVASHVTAGGTSAPSRDPNLASHVTSGDLEREGEGEGDAAAASAPARKPTGPGALHPAFDEVAGILEACRQPDGGRLVVEPASIDSALQAHASDRCPLPAERRVELAVSAAHETAAIVQAGRNSTRDATSLFGGVLRRAVEQARRPAAGAPPRATARQAGGGRQLTYSGDLSRFDS